jgi:NAD(P)H-dependent FMN reductase
MSSDSPAECGTTRCSQRASAYTNGNQPYKVGYFVGSLATKSINRLLAKALMKLAPPELQLTEISFKDLPLYSYDYDAKYPAVATEFTNAIVAVDAVLFVTPEYNRSIPGALKNAIDWASRPYGTNALTRKPSAVIGRLPERSARQSPNNISAAFLRSAIRH